MTAQAQTILVLDDEALIGMEVEAILHDAGYRVAGPALDVAESLALIESGPIHGALLDHDLFAERSDAVADRLTALGIPFAYLTGRAEAVVQARGAAAPVISKPAQPRTIRAVLGTLLDGASPAR